MSQIDVPKRLLTTSEIPNYTDAIQINSLGSPQGFDDDQYHFNVHRMLGVLRAGGVGHLTIGSFDGEASSVSIQPTDLGNSRAAATGLASSTKASLLQTVAGSSGQNNAYYSSLFDRPSRTINLNRNELNQAVINV